MCVRLCAFAALSRSRVRLSLALGLRSVSLRLCLRPSSGSLLSVSLSLAPFVVGALSLWPSLPPCRALWPLCLWPFPPLASSPPALSPVCSPLALRLRLPSFALCRPWFLSASLHALPPLFSAAVVAAPPLSDRFGRGIGIGNLGT